MNNDIFAGILIALIPSAISLLFTHLAQQKRNRQEVLRSVFHDFCAAYSDFVAEPNAKHIRTACIAELQTLLLFIPDPDYETARRLYPLLCQEHPDMKEAAKAYTGICKIGRKLLKSPYDFNS